MQEIKVSVLIPVYGVEKYIEKCAHSLFQQTMKEGIEFIFVDDSTPDRSIEILQQVLSQYPERLNQVKIVRHPENMGLAEARVTGIKEARGEYVIHCDSDDWVETDMYESLYIKAQETDADIVGCDYFLELKKSSIYRNQYFNLPQNKILNELATLKGLLSGFLVTRMIKRDFYNKGNYRADKGITLLEDLAVTFKMHQDTNKVEYIPKPLYHYNRVIDQSITSEFSPAKINSAISVFNKLLTLDLNKKLRKKIIKRRNNLYLYYIDNFHPFNANLFRNRYLQEIPDDIIKDLKGSQKFRFNMVSKGYDKVAKLSLFVDAVSLILKQKIKRHIYNFKYKS